MNIKNTKKNSHGKKVVKLAMWQKLAIIVSAVVVVGGVSATVYALTVDASKNTTVPVNNSSEISSPPSSEPSSEISSEPSSEPSSQESKEESSKVASKAPAKPASSKPASSKPASSKPAASATPAKNSNSAEGIQERFVQQYNQNKDMVGWIKLDGTKLNYPVVKGRDNSFYLNHDFNKKIYGWGVPFMGYNVTFNKDVQSRNVILFGHSDDKRVLQCSALKGYRKIDFYKQHPTIHFDSLYEDATYKVVGFLITNENCKNWFQYYTTLDGGSDEEFNSFIQKTRERSYINTNVDAVPSDKLLTIQTCEDTNSNNFNRLVLVARKVRPDEDASVDTSGATQNSNQVLPK